MLATYKSGAEAEAEIVTRYENGAEVEAEAVYDYKDGAEVEVWSAMEIMRVVSCTNPNGRIEVRNDKQTLLFWRTEDKTGAYGSVTGASTITFRLDELLSAPTIGVDWEGGFLRQPSATSTNVYRETGGTIKLYAYKADGSYDYKGITVGSSATLSGFVFEIGSTTYSFTGEYTHIDVTIALKSYAQQYYFADQLIQITNLVVNGEYVGFATDAEDYSILTDDY